MDKKPKKSVSRRSAGRCSTSYDYAAYSATGFIVAGRLNFTVPTNIQHATLTASREAAKVAHETSFPFDPFNLNIAVKPIRKTKSK